MAGLVVAKDLGIQTGGTAPQHWMTEKGCQQELLHIDKDKYIGAAPTTTTTLISIVKHYEVIGEPLPSTAMWRYPNHPNLDMPAKGMLQTGFCNSGEIVPPNLNRLMDILGPFLRGTRFRRSPGIKTKLKRRSHFFNQTYKGRHPGPCL